MEVPKVNLVDGIGRKIGTFSDDKDWWEQIKKEQFAILGPMPGEEENPEVDFASHHNLKIQDVVSEYTAKLTPRNIAGESDLTGDLSQSKAEFINKNLNTSQRKNIKMTLSVDSGLSEDERLEKEKEALQKLKNNCKQIGETPLHIAIMHNDLPTIKYLIEEKGISVNQRCSEGKFSNGFDEYGKKFEKSEYTDVAYYGEYPLCLAACFASKEIYDYLIDQGADPNLIDSNGNTILHTLVINDRLEMFLYASNHPKSKANLSLKNSQGLTPFNLAAKLAKLEIFTQMLEINEILIWQYSNIRCSVYPLESIDTISNDGSIDLLSSLGFIVNGETDEHLEMLRIGFIDRLLEDKWAQFAETMFFKKMIISVFHLIFLTIAVYTRAGDQPYVAPSTVTANTVARYIFEALTFIGCIGILVMQGLDLKKQGIREYLANLVGEPANVFYNLFCILIILAFPWRFIDTGNSLITAKNVEDHFVILAIPCAWLHLLFYARVATLTGPFVVMIYKMIAGDVLIFTKVFIMFHFGFTLGFYYLYKDADEAVSTMHSILESLFQTFLWAIGEYKDRLPEYDRVLHSVLLKIIFVVHSLFVHIMMFNMLIALMGNTYRIINAKAEKEWRKQWAHSILLLEQGLDNESRKGFQNRYAMALPDPDPTKPDKAVLMVIKKVNTTRSIIRKRSMELWKTSTRAVRDKLRFYGNCKGTDLLDIWANKGKKQHNKKPVDWKLYGGAPKNRPNIKKPAEQANKMDKIEDAEDLTV